MRGKEFICNDISYLQNLGESSEEEREDEIKSASWESMDSEKSYSPVFTKNVLLENFKYLTFNLSWMFWVSIVHTILFVLVTYDEIFYVEFDEPLHFLISKLLCNLFYLIDIVSCGIHMFSKDVSKRIHKKRNRIRMRGKEFICNDISYLQNLGESSEEEREDEIKSASWESMDSEKSYSPVFTKNVLLENFKYLTFNLSWMFWVSIVHTILFVLVTYDEIFYVEYDEPLHSLISKLLCNLFYLIDIVSCGIHMFSKDVSKRIHKKRNRIILVLDILSLILSYAALLPVLYVNQAMRYIVITLVIFRLHRAISYYLEISVAAGFNNVGVLLKKYGLMFFLCVHTFSMGWQLMNCYDNVNRSQCWSDTIDEFIEMDQPRPYQWYIICLYCIMGSFASLGLGMEHSYNTGEALLSISIMLVGLTVMNGVFLGAFTSVQSDQYRRHAQFADRFKLINTSLNHKRLSKRLRKKILQYYLSFWRQQGSIKQSRLFESLPSSLQQQVLLDKYWNALNQSHLFRRVHDAYKRAIAAVMTTEIYAQGEVIFSQGKENEKMFYIARGTVQILSGNDGESPILTLDMGSVLGEVNLMYSIASPCQVIASSFCIVHLLDKTDLWRVTLDYRKLKQTRKLHKIFKNKIQVAVEREDRMINKDIVGESKVKCEKALKRIKEEVFQDRMFKIEKSHSTLKISRKFASSVNTVLADLYTVSRQQTALRHTDEICLHTTWPWILQPASSLLTFWETIAVVTVFFVSITYPYCICFNRSFTSFMILAMVLVDIIYLLDIILQLFTAIENEQGITSRLTLIFSMRIRSLSFILDMLATLPLGLVCRFTHITYDERILNVVQMNRILKIHKIVKFFNKLENSFRFNIAIIRCFKYVLALIFMTYFMGSLYYMVACFYPKCEKGWYHALISIDVHEGGIRSSYPFEVSLYFAMMVVSQSGYARIYAYTYAEMVILMLFFVMGILTFSYLVSDYSATLMLANRSYIIYVQTVSVIRQFMVTNRMPVTLQNRTNEYLASQWRDKKGMLTWDLLGDAPGYLYEEQQAAKYATAFSTVPLFHDLESSCINRLAAKCITLLLPPNEIVVYAGEVSKEMFIIEKGYCEVISAISGKIEKILRPGQHFYTFEMLLEQPGIFNIRTLTHVRFIKISYQNIKNVLIYYPEIKEDINGLVSAMKKSLTVQRLFMRSRTVAYQQLVEEESKSFFVFPRRKLDLRNIDYLRVFANMGIGKIFKVFLMRRTILPYGQFICIWEMIRGLVAILSGMLYPALLIHQTYMPSIKYYVLILDVIGFVDIYIRLHVCYYNEKAILVTHPKCTAINYLCHSFFMDFLSVAPVDFMLNLVYSIDMTNKAESESTYFVWQSVCRYLKLLQLYRLPDSFAYFKRDLFKPPGVWLTTLKYVLFSLVLFNALANILILISYNIESSGEYYKITPKPHTWLNPRYEFSFDMSNAVNIYITAYYWMAATSLSINFGMLIAIEKNEMYFVIMCIIMGYLLFTYIFVIISSSKSSIDVSLTLYQQHMKHLINYMKVENIPKAMQKKAIDHFEYIWKRTHGMKAGIILKQCHPALREDCVLNLYENTLAMVPIFADLNKSFYRLLGTHLEEAYFLRDSPIVKLNDIIHTIYIIHKGEVSIHGPDGYVFAVLKRGCMFGNLDDMKYSRSMVTAVASKAVDLLFINTEVMYYLVKDYQVVQSRLRKHILLENMSYVNRKIIVEDDSFEKLDTRDAIKFEKRTRVEKLIFSRALDLPMMIVSYLSCIVVTYHAAFQDHHFAVLAFTYLFDSLLLLKIYVNFFTPYVDDMGEVITDRNKIKRRIIHLPRFYIELFAIVPFEVFALFSKEVYYWLAILRLSKLLRWFNLTNFFNVTYDYLNVNILLVRLGTILIYFSLLLHIGACLLYWFACFGGECSANNWLMTRDGVEKCQFHYVCSFFFVTSILTFTGYGDVVPRSLSDVCLVTCLIILGKYTLATFVGDMSAIVYSLSSTLVNYDHGMKKLKEYLKNGNISQPLKKKIIDYAYQLWSLNKGVQLPQLLAEAPSFLIEDLKMEAYGKHLTENFVFKDCHKDFIRLLIAKFKVQTFFHGDLICQQGDINNTMFFVHNGRVNVFAISEREEEQVDELKELDCFGMIQGLFPYCPHTHTYIAESVCVILTLSLNDWLVLLKFYPAARFDIFRKIQTI